MNAVYTVLKNSEIQMSQSFTLTYRFILSHITGQAFSRERFAAVCWWNRRLIMACIFCLQVDGFVTGGLLSGGERAYNWLLRYVSF